MPREDSSTTTIMGNTITSSTTAAAATATTTTTTITKLRIVSYNVLSSSLANVQSYPTYNPKHLDSKNRLSLLLQKLEKEIRQPTSSTTKALTTNTSTSTKRSTIFCLQEVSYEWAGQLHTFFANHQYHVVTGLYGQHFNGYMGVLTAYPIQDFTTINVDICRLADTYQTNWPKKRKYVPNNTAESKQQELLPMISNLITSTLQFFNVLPKNETSSNNTVVREPEDHWSSAQRRHNVLLSIVLQPKTSDSSVSAGDEERSQQQQFVIGNYHMPCVYYNEKVMVLHSDLCVARVQQIASCTPVCEDNDTNIDKPALTNIPSRRPYVLAGDFNIKPNDTAYKLLTTGLIDRSDPAYPSNPSDLLYEISATTTTNNVTMVSSSPPTSEELYWKPLQVEPVRSVYAIHNLENNKDGCNTKLHTSGTGEPDFTNYALMGGGGGDDDSTNATKLPFIDTLDYIFISSSEYENHRIVVQDVLSLPNRDDPTIHGPFPNEIEPSDHILISADIDIVPS